ncbi:MAG: hypothetical protein WC866_06240 [Patescibacteria group bacterium]
MKTNPTHQMFYEAFGRTFGSLALWPEFREQLVGKMFTFDHKVNSHGSRQLSGTITAVEVYGDVRNAGIVLHVSTSRFWSFHLISIEYHDDQRCWSANVESRASNCCDLPGTLTLH